MSSNRLIRWIVVAADDIIWPGIELLNKVATRGAQPGNRMVRARIIEIGVSIWLTALMAVTCPGAPPQFDTDVAPILRAHCTKCHGTGTIKGGLDLRTAETLLHGGDSGAVVVSGKSGDSLIVEQVVSKAMPPGKNPRLTAAEIAILRTWIDAGAPGGTTATAAASPANAKFWSFQPPIRPQVPVVHEAGKVHNPIDEFLLAGLEAKGLTFSSEASRRTLVRRLYFDLWGLPPTPEQSDAFLADQRPDAWERLIDSLLASPRYGERWGRHWLDLAGYADSEGILAADYERSAAWRYRDYVVRAFNEDTPYDQFLRLQIAGDEVVDYPSVFYAEKTLGPRVVDALVATGYLRCASDTSRPDFAQIKNAPGYYYQTLEDTMKIVASSTMGLTLECAKCHSHKYDPITQEEYYQVQAVFMSGYRPAQWIPQVERKLNESTAAQNAEAAAFNARIDAKVAELTARARLLKASFATRLFDDRVATLPQPIRDDTQQALAADTTRRTEVQKYLASRFATYLRPPDKDLPKLLSVAYPDYKTQAASIAATIAAEQAAKRTFPEIRAFYDLPGDVKTPLLKRGEYTQPGREVGPGVIRALGTPKPFAWSPPTKGARTSGRRLAFAQWLTQPGHPLTARVMVNRIWLLHFGEGIVSTPDNFGKAGAAPSHPALLDWLATEFVARGWSVKAMHRLILASAAYRQASGIDASSPVQMRAKQVDPDNRLLWRQRMRRLEAEPLRDAMLATAGTLNAQMFGPPVPLSVRADGEVVEPDDAAGLRRSIYHMVRRSLPLTLLQSFDQPVMETNCTRRGISTVASQALNLLNSDALARHAQAFAARVENEAPDDPAEQAVRLALNRPPSVSERTVLDAFLTAQSRRHARALAGPGAKPTADQLAGSRRQALADLCQMLMSSNEFAYVD
jgi:Protein of unknown function (DUF1553)/Protein of unknown function (DUF1549)/Planctomycete cytochrome C